MSSIPRRAIRTVTLWVPRTLHRLYAFFVIEHVTRRVHILGVAHGAR